VADGVRLRALARDDLPLLSRWLDREHVRRWWVGDAADVPTLERRYGPSIDGADPTRVFVILAGGRPVGIIQRYALADEPEWSDVLSVGIDLRGAAGIDYLVGEPSALGRGVATAAIRACVEETYAAGAATGVVVAVQQANSASWRALERAGFVRAWAGRLASDDPADAGPAYLYVHRRDGVMRPAGRAPR
jgi:aminoglycoside 6'-N-acetyltransferase